MSFSQKQIVTCECGHEFEWDIWSSINVTRDPDLKETLFNGLLNVVVCPFCGIFFYFETFILYHDEKKKYLFYIYNHDCPEDKTKLTQKAKEDCELVNQKAEKKIFLDYKVEVFFGLDEVLEFLKKEEDL
ncbi:MAG: hypothetical protein A2539_10180 [Elusimicrobia bacterium RIFOXYD2_FULL_34_15]|nr:MAG: hypothetical protein A2539_10180 [Elusimicrobia bacterium RIFOXYD2_FULL_34_15]